MKVDHLFVIAFTHSASDETAKSARALFDKVRVPEPTSKCLVHIDTRTPLQEHAGSIKKATALNGGGVDLFANGTIKEGITLIDGHVSAGFDSSANVGVYLVFHCSSNGVPYIFDRTLGLATEVAAFGKLKTNAEQLVQIMSRTGLAKIRKLCLVACTTTKGSEAYENGFLGVLCDAMIGPFNPPPMIAGWDDYVTVVEGGRKQVSEERLAKDHPNHKKVAVFDGKGYSIERLEKSGWSDKKQEPTELGASSTF